MVGIFWHIVFACAMELNIEIWIPHLTSLTAVCMLTCFEQFMNMISVLLTVQCSAAVQLCSCRTAEQNSCRTTEQLQDN